MNKCKDAMKKVMNEFNEIAKDNIELQAKFRKHDPNVSGDRDSIRLCLKDRDTREYNDMDMSFYFEEWNNEFIPKKGDGGLRRRTKDEVLFFNKELECALSEVKDDGEVVLRYGDEKYYLISGYDFYRSMYYMVAANGLAIGNGGYSIDICDVKQACGKSRLKEILDREKDYAID